jgi:hypothetical protein
MKSSLKVFFSSFRPTRVSAFVAQANSGEKIIEKPKDPKP